MANSSQINLGSLLSVCIDAAQRAGAIIRKVWKSGKLDIKEKGKDDPFTIADVHSQQLIMGLLRKKWPKLQMVGEEECEILPSSLEPKLDIIDLQKVPEIYRSVELDDIVVFIDPLDATKEFTVGNLEAVMSLVGIAIKGEAVAGVMYQPFVDHENLDEGKTIWGMKGMGTVGIQTKFRNDGKIVLATTRTHSDAAVELAVQLIHPDSVLKVGGSGHKSYLVLQGVADVYVFPTIGTKKWDTCAPEAIIEAAGGSFTDKKGHQIPYFVNSDPHNRDGILCSMKDHQKYVDLIKPLSNL